MKHPSKELPVKIQIGYRTYDLELMSEVTSDIADCTGAHNDLKGKILFSGDIDDQELSMVLLHECLHGIFREYHLPDENEEHYVTVLTHGLISLMKDNPLLFEFIRENS